MFKYVHIKNHNEAHRMMRKYIPAIPDRYFELLEDVLIGSRKEAFIPQSEIDKWEEEKERQNARDQRIALTAERNNQGTAFEKAGDIEGAIEQYEQNVSDRVTATQSYDRLMILYRRQKKFKDEIRVIDIANEVFTEVNEVRYRNAATKPENRKYLAELQTAMEECRGVKNDEGWYIFSPYPVMKWILRREKVEALLQKSNPDYLPRPVAPRAVKWQPVIPRADISGPLLDPGGWDIKKLIAAAAILIFVGAVLWLII